MSLAHAPPSIRGNTTEQQSTVQKLLDENSRLIDIITEFQNQGRADDSVKHQQLLHRNLVHLAQLADPYLLQQLKDDTQIQAEQQQQQLHQNGPSAGLAPHPHHTGPGISPGQSQMQQGQPGMPPAHQSFAPPPMGADMMNQYQASQMRQPPQGYPPFGQPGPQMGPGQPRMPPGYPYPPQGIPPGYPGGPPPHSYDGGYPHPGQMPPGGPPPQQFMQ